MGRADQPGAPAPLVLPGQRRPQGRRQFPARRKRGWRDPPLRPADVAPGDVRRPGQRPRRALAETGDKTTVELTHTVPLAMAGSGAGALFVGPGWDGALLGLGIHLRGLSVGDPLEAANSPEVIEFNSGSISRWTEAIDPQAPPRRRRSLPPVKRPSPSTRRPLPDGSGSVVVGASSGSPALTGRIQGGNMKYGSTIGGSAQHRGSYR